TVITVPPGETRYFIAGKDGTISIIENGAARAPAFAKLTVLDSGEEGLLGMAFHPGYASNGRLFVYFTAADMSERIWELHRGANASSTDGTHKELMVIPHDQAPNHNGGNILFGPDGMLYIGTGDGGGRFGSNHHSPRLTTR